MQKRHVPAHLTDPPAIRSALQWEQKLIGNPDNEEPYHISAKQMRIAFESEGSSYADLDIDLYLRYPNKSFGCKLRPVTTSTSTFRIKEAAVFVKIFDLDFCLQSYNLSCCFEIFLYLYFFYGQLRFACEL